jgi:hypothetical protein
MSGNRTMSLGEYISELIEVLARTQPAAMSRLRQIVGSLRSRIMLDEEAVDIWLEPEGLRVQPADPFSRVDGIGATDNSTVLALLDGVVEVSDAILDGTLRVTGEARDISRMFMAIDILLDASARVPELERVSDRFRAERAGQRAAIAPGSGRAPWYPFRGGQREESLLTRLGLKDNGRE